MKKLAITLFALFVLILMAWPLFAAGPFGIFGPRRGGPACGPGGCQVMPAPEPERVVYQPVYQPERIAAPADSTPSLQAFQLNGVVQENVNGTKECHYSLSGKKVNKYEAFGAAFDDDSESHWLIITGEGREKVEADLRADPKNADLLSHTRIWSKPNGHFSLIDRDTSKQMFPVGNPGIYFARSDGSELWAQAGYKGPADIEALRRADPKIKPDEKKPDTPASASPLLTGVAPFVAIAVVAGFVLLFLRRQQ